MLLLSRRPDESIVIGDNIQIKILKIEGSQVQIGIEAPKSVPIHRLEIYLAIRSENQASSESSLDDLTKTLNKYKNQHNS